MSTRSINITVALLLSTLYAGSIYANRWFQELQEPYYALVLLLFLFVVNISYSIFYFLNEFRYDKVTIGLMSMAQTEKIQKRRKYLTWYWLILISISQLFVFASLFQIFHKLGGDSYFSYERPLHFSDWILYTLDGAFKSILDIPEIFNWHLRNIKHHGFIGSFLVATVRLVIYSTLFTVLLRQWNKWRRLRDTIHAMNIAPEFAGRRLVRMGEEALPSLESTLLKPNLLHSDSKSRDPLARNDHSEPLLQMLLRKLNTGDQNERLNSAALLGMLALEDRSSDPYYRSMLEVARRDPVPKIRVEVVRAIGKLDDRRIYSHLRKFLLDPETEVREQAAIALGKARDHRSIHALEAKLSDPESVVRISATKSLGQIGHKNATSILKKALQHNDYNVKLEATFSLAHLSCNDVTPNLIHLLKADQEKIQLKAIKSLSKLRPQESFKALAQCLHDPSGEVREKASQTMGRLNPEAAAQEFIHFQNEDSPSVKREWIRVFRGTKNPEYRPYLEKMAQDPDQLVRERSLSALGALQDKDAASFLLELIRNSNDDTDQINAMLALGESNQIDIYEELLEIAQKTNNQYLKRHAIRSIVKLSPYRASKDLLPFIDDKQIRTDVACALVELREREAVPGLIAVYQKVSDPDLKKVLWQGLKQISGQDLPESPKAWRKWLKAKQAKEAKIAKQAENEKLAKEAEEAKLIKEAEETEQVKPEVKEEE